MSAEAIATYQARIAALEDALAGAEVARDVWKEACFSWAAAHHKALVETEALRRHSSLGDPVARDAHYAAIIARRETR